MKRTLLLLISMIILQPAFSVGLEKIRFADRRIQFNNFSGSSYDVEDHVLTFGSSMFLLNSTNFDVISGSWNVGAGISLTIELKSSTGASFDEDSMELVLWYKGAQPFTNPNKYDMVNYMKWSLHADYKGDFGQDAYDVGLWNSVKDPIMWRTGASYNINHYELERDNDFSTYGVSHWSSSQTATGMNRPEKASLNFLLYPNPAADIIKVFFDQHDRDGQYHLLIVDITGREVRREDIIFHEESHTLIIPVSKLRPGTYFVVLTDHTGQVIGTKKFVKE